MSNLATGRNNPFWLRANNFGQTSDSAQSFQIQLEIKKDFDSLYFQNKRLKAFDWGYGIATGVILGRETKSYTPEIYIKGRLKNLELTIGRRRDFFGISDSTNSSGHLINSQNTIPIPKVSLIIPNYHYLFKNKILGIKAGLSHGWFGDQYYTKESFLHQKWLYVSIGKPTWRFNFYTGLNHNVQWGGKINNIPSHIFAVNGKFPSSLKDFLFVSTGLSLNRQYSLPDSLYTYQDLTNRVGNHLGSIDVGLRFQINGTTILFYRQNIYDDGSLFYLSNLDDGLSGISINFPKTSKAFFGINNLTFEFFNSRNQGGALGPEQNNNYLRGTDNYFNNAQFLDGWSYKGNTLGTSFIPSRLAINKTLPQYQVNVITELPTFFYTNNNRVSAIYIASQTFVYNHKIKVKYSISNNLGTYTFPFAKPIRQKSMLMEHQYFIKSLKTLLETQIGYDSPGIYEKNLGVKFVLLKKF
ncbi:MAG: capsule assembly Wzi family protein [Cytophagales bacterium]|nr:capsule assembly Wzi family protein [Cytophagales bacterium]